jgi:hypothetical protein
MLTHIHPSCVWFTCKTSSYLMGSGCPSSASGPVPEPPSAQSPFARLGCYLQRRDVEHLVRGHYPSFITLTNSCARPKSSGQLRYPYFGRSLQVAVSPCWKMALPDVISTICVKALGPIPRSVPWYYPFGLHAVGKGALATKDICLALRCRGSARQMIPAMQLQQGMKYRGCSHSLMFRLPHLLDPPVAPTTVSSTGQPGRLRHAMNMWLPALIAQGFT